MTIEQIRKLHKAQPFRPFRVHLADGRTFDVPHSEFLYSTPSGRTIIVADSDDSVEIIDLLLVTSLELVNGRSKRSRSS